MREKGCVVGVAPPSHSTSNFLRLFPAGYMSHLTVQAQRGAVQGFCVICNVFKVEIQLPLQVSRGLDTAVV